MAFYTHAWFWLLALGLIFIIVGIIFQFTHHTGWFIFFLCFGIFFIFISIIAAVISGASSTAQKQTAQVTELLKDPGVQQLALQAAPLLL